MIIDLLLDYYKNNKHDVLKSIKLNQDDIFIKINIDNKKMEVMDIKNEIRDEDNIKFIKERIQLSERMAINFGLQDAGKRTYFSNNMFTLFFSLKTTNKPLNSDEYKDSMIKYYKSVLNQNDNILKKINLIPIDDIKNTIYCHIKENIQSEKRLNDITMNRDMINDNLDDIIEYINNNKFFKNKVCTNKDERKYRNVYIFLDYPIEEYIKERDIYSLAMKSQDIIYENGKLKILSAFNNFTLNADKPTLIIQNNKKITNMGQYISDINDLGNLTSIQFLIRNDFLSEINKDDYSIIFDINKISKQKIPTITGYQLVNKNENTKFNNMQLNNIVYKENKQYIKSKDQFYTEIDNRFFNNKLEIEGIYKYFIYKKEFGELGNKLTSVMKTQMIKNRLNVIKLVNGDALLDIQKVDLRKMMYMLSLDKLKTNKNINEFKKSINLYFNINMYMQGDGILMNSEIRKRLQKELLDKDCKEIKINNDDEYFILIGQYIYNLLSFSKSDNKFSDIPFVTNSKHTVNIRSFIERIKRRYANLVFDTICVNKITKVESALTNYPIDRKLNIKDRENLLYGICSETIFYDNNGGKK